MTDTVEPVRIEHRVDEVWDDVALVERYNFLDYHFARDGACCRARAYVDDVEAVTLFGPFAAPDSIRRVEAPALERDVLAYLERRFRQVTRG